MSTKGDLYYAWSNSNTIKGECEEAVISLLKYALKNKIVDVVLTVKKGVDIYDPQPVFITSPTDLDACTGSLHCGTLLMPKLIKKYLNGAKDIKVAITCKGCDAKALIELGKRQQINLNNVISIGLN